MGYLCITRFTREGIRLGDGIEILVMKVDRGKVMLGIKCDRENFPVTRFKEEPPCPPSQEPNASKPSS